MIDPKKVEQFLLENPIFFVSLGLLALTFLEKRGTVPAWAKDLPALKERLAGPWRGKGSFGHGFGPQARHR
jgi:hypothetical protein